MTDSSTVRPGNSVLIWNVRVMPRLTRSCCDSVVTLSLPRNTSPAVGGNTPVSRLMNVVLPAPLGPISAWRAPGANSSEMSLLASNAPQRFDSRCVRNALVTSARRRSWLCPQPGAQRVEPAEDPAVREQDDDDQEEADPELPVHGVDARQVVLRDHEDRRADETAVQPAGAAQHQHDH